MNSNFKWVKSDKFNTITLLISFVNRMEESKMWYYNLLASILSASTDKYRTKKELSGKMYELYNSTVSWTSGKSNESGFMHLLLEFVNPIYVNDENLFNESFELLEEMLYHPYLNDTNDAFNETIYKEKKLMLINRIKNIKDDKDRYAYNIFLEKMKRKNEFPLINNYDIEEIEKINNKDLYEYYKYIISNSKVVVTGIGNCDENLIYKKIEKLKLIQNNIKFSLYTDKNFPVEEVKYFEETQDIEQARLNMGFRTTISINDTMYPAYIVFNVMFGGMFNSTLANVIREEKSLCYSIYSSIIQDKKIFTVYTGVDTGKVDEVIELIKEIVNNYKTGNIIKKDELLQMAKENIINDIECSLDSQGSSLLEMFKDIINPKVNLNILKELIRKVEIMDVINASKTIQLDTIFVLKGKIHE